MEFTWASITSVILASAVPLGLILGHCNRKQGERGIGSQFIRWTVLTTSLPITGVLTLNGLLSGEVAAGLIGAAVGYAFGKNDRGR